MYRKSGLDSTGNHPTSVTWTENNDGKFKEKESRKKETKFVRKKRQEIMRSVSEGRKRAK